jgi:hypothetical protein
MVFLAHFEPTQRARSRQISHLKTAPISNGIAPRKSENGSSFALPAYACADQKDLQNQQKALEHYVLANGWPLTIGCLILETN